MLEGFFFGAKQMKLPLRVLGVAALVSAFTVGISPLSARVVCSASGDCWHTDSDYSYNRDLRVEAHPDDWYFHRHWDSDREHHWRDYHEGRGYWRNGVWVTF